MAPRGLWLALVAVLLLVAGPARAADDKISEEAKGYFRNGVELIQGSPPNYQDAYYQFKLAYEKSGSWKVLGNLGLCALKLERDGEALDHYTNYLKQGGSDIDPEERKALERDSLLISGNSAVVNISSVSPDADIIDQRGGSSVPPQAYKLTGGALTLRLRAGTHAITASTADGKQEKWEILLSPGKTVDHRFEFAAAPAAVPVAAAATPAGTPPPAEPAAEPKKGSPLRTVGYVTAGVGVAALIGGVITGVMANSAEDDALGKCNAQNVCQTSAEDDFDSAESMAMITNVLLIGGGVLAATGVTLIIVGGGKSSEKAASLSPPPARLQLTPMVTAGGGGLFASGSF